MPCRIGANRYFAGGEAAASGLVPADPEKTAYLTDLLPGCRLLASNWKRIEDERRKLLDNFRRIREAVAGGRGDTPEVDAIFSFPYDRLRVVDLVDFGADPAAAVEIRVLAKAITDLDNADVEELRRKAGQGYRLLAYAADARLLENLRSQLTGLECHFFNIPCSFENPLLRLVCLSGRNYRPAERAARARPAPPEEALRDMAEGDWVVHRRHGIGRFAGFKRLRLEDMTAEFLKIEYVNREFLYVPLHELDVLKRYSGTEGAVPALDRLGGKTWQAKTERARKAIVTYTRDLLDLYAMRKSVRKTALCCRARAGGQAAAGLPLRRDRGPEAGHPPGAGRHGGRLPHGPPDLRRRQLRQDRGGPARRPARHGQRPPGRLPLPDDHPGAAALPQLRAPPGRLPAAAGHALAPGRRRPKRSASPPASRAAPSTWWWARTRCWPRGWSSSAWGCSSSTRSSASASSRRRSSRRGARRSTCSPCRPPPSRAPSPWPSPGCRTSR